jgi:hypothetical protein
VRKACVVEDGIPPKDHDSNREAEIEALQQEQTIAEGIAAGEAERIAKSPYFNEAGDPQLLDAVVLFLDLLGTRGVRSPQEARDHLYVTRRAMQQARRWSLSTGSRDDEGAIYSFSDNIGLGYPLSSHLGPLGSLVFMFTEVSFLQLAFANMGFFSRGAIAKAGFFADPDPELGFIHGPALERAVALEKSRAEYPRVILDEATIAAVHEAAASESDGPNPGWSRQLVRDGDGEVFVNYLIEVFEGVIDEVIEPAAFLALHKDHIEGNLRRYDGVRRVEEKYRWLAGYHNYFISTFSGADFQGSVEPVICSRPLGQFEPFTP